MVPPDNNFDLIIKMIATLAAILTTFYQFRKLKLATRSSIKTDLEILNMLDNSDPNYKIVKESVDFSTFIS